MTVSKGIHFENQPNGTGITVANSSTYGDSALSTVLATNGTTAYSTDRAAHGLVSAKLSMNSGATSCQMGIGLGGANSTSFGARGYIYLGSLPTASVRMFEARSATAGLGGLNVNTSGSIAATDISGTALNVSSSTTQAMQVNTWYRLEFVWTISATTGQYKVGVYPLDSSSPYYSYTSAATMNSGTTPITEVRMGKLTNTGTIAAPWYIDDFNFVDPSSTFLGAYQPLGPSVSTTITPGYAKVDATGSAAVNGGALSYSLSPSTGVLQPTAGIFYVPQTSSAQTFTLTVSEAGGSSTNSSVTVPALVSAASSGTSVLTQRYIGGSWQ